MPKLSFVLESTKSELEDILFYERVNQESLEELIRSSAIDKTPCSQWISTGYNDVRHFLLKYQTDYSSSVEGVQTVKYATKSLYSGIGRVYPNRHLSMGCLQIKARHTLCRDKYTDLDVVNCHPVLAYQIFEANGIELPLLKRYIKKRDSILGKLIEATGLERWQVKQLFIRLMYGGTVSKWEEDHEIEPLNCEFVNNFAKECKLIQSTICTKNPEHLVFFKKERKEGAERTLTSLFFQHVERMILEELVKVFKSKACKLIPVHNTKNGIALECFLCFDGITIPKCTDVDHLDHCMRIAEASIRENIGYDITLSEKPMDEGYTEEEISVPTPPKINVRPFGEFDRQSMISRTVYCKQAIDKVLKDRNYEGSNKLTQKEIMNEVFDLKQEANTRTYDIMKPYFEKYMSIMVNPSCVLQLTQVGILPHNDSSVKRLFGDIYLPYSFSPRRPTFIERWMADEDRLEYTNTDFLPPPNNTPSRVFNMFQGFEIEKISPELPTLHPLIESHIRSLAGDDKPEECYNYLLNYIADIFQRPGILPGVAIVFKSEPGAGKDMFFEAIGKMLGHNMYFATANLEELTGSFNNSHEKLIVVLNEASGKDTFKSNDIIKNFITETSRLKNEKFVKAYKVRNFARVLAFTNNDVSFKIMKKGRRFVILECSSDNIGNTDYFNALYKCLNDKKILRQFYEYLMARDISEFTPHANRPITKIYEEMESVNTPTCELFIHDYVENLRRPIVHRITTQDFYVKFEEWCREGNRNLTGGMVNITANRFTRLINKISGITRTTISVLNETTHRTTQKRAYEIDPATVALMFPEDTIMEDICMC